MDQRIRAGSGCDRGGDALAAGGIHGHDLEGARLGSGYVAQHVLGGLRPDLGQEGVGCCARVVDPVGGDRDARVLRVVARVHRTREAESLKKLGVVDLISPEYQASIEFLVRVLAASGWGQADIERALAVARQDKAIVEFSSDQEE